MRAYAPNYRTIWLVNDLQRVRPDVQVRLLPPSRGVGSRRIQITVAGEVQRITLAEARRMVAEAQA